MEQSPNPFRARDYLKKYKWRLPKKVFEELNGCMTKFFMDAKYDDMRFRIMAQRIQLANLETAYIAQLRTLEAVRYRNWQLTTERYSKKDPQS